MIEVNAKELRKPWIKNARAFLHFRFAWEKIGDGMRQAEEDFKGTEFETSRLHRVAEERVTIQTVDLPAAEKRMAAKLRAAHMPVIPGFGGAV